MFKKIKWVDIYTPTGISSYEIGKETQKGIDKDGKPIMTGQFIKKISINIFRNVKVELSDGTVYRFKKFPISYET